MKLGTVTYNMCKDMDLPTLIDFCQKIGLEAVELRTTHKHGVEPTLTAEEREDVKKRFADSKVRLLSLGSICEFHSADHGVVQQNIEVCKTFVQLAKDIGAIGVKVRPNGYVNGVPHETTNEQIGKALRECGKFAESYGVGIWAEVHGNETQEPKNMRIMMNNADHPNVGICWNSNQPDVVDGSVRQSFDLLKKWIRNVHINELPNPKYPYRELFHLLKEAGYQGYCLTEIGYNPEPERFMKYYRALWQELAEIS